MTELLEIDGLNVEFPSRHGAAVAVLDASLTVSAGEIVALVGESGAGKSTIGNAVTGLLERPGRVSGGKILFKGEEIQDLSDDEMRKIRGRRIATIFQDPQSSLNPLLTIGKQLTETISYTIGLKPAEARVRAAELLKSVGISNPESRLAAYPHEFSGGMRQRVVIALALAGEPELVIADEPTTALDVSIQAQILDLVREACRERQLGVLFVTHDIGVVAEIADRVVVMYRGKIVETGEVQDVLERPQHAYTQSLISAVPRADVRLKRFDSVDFIDGNIPHRTIDIETHWLGQRPIESVAIDGPIISLRDVSVTFDLNKSFFKRNRSVLKAVDDVSFDIIEGETFGLVGESGSGKSTLAKVIAGLENPAAGSLSILGKDIGFLAKDTARNSIRKDLQFVFQDPFSSLNARMRVADIVAEPIRFYHLTESKQQTATIVGDLLEHVGLGAEAARKFPHEFSGGQRQRIAIARALASRPRILICDEPTSALDVSIQAQILNLLRDLQDDLGLTMLFISHDLPVVRQMCDRIAVLRNGKICEVASNENLFSKPQHEYTQHLLDLMPSLGSQNVSRVEGHGVEPHIAG